MYLCMLCFVFYNNEVYLFTQWHHEVILLIGVSSIASSSHTHVFSLPLFCPLSPQLPLPLHRFIALVRFPIWPAFVINKPSGCETHYETHGEDNGNEDRLARFVALKDNLVFECWRFELSGDVVEINGGHTTSVDLIFTAFDHE